MRLESFAKLLSFEKAGRRIRCSETSDPKISKSVYLGISFYPHRKQEDSQALIQPAPAASGTTEKSSLTSEVPVENQVEQTQAIASDSFLLQTKSISQPTETIDTFEKTKKNSAEYRASELAASATRQPARFPLSPVVPGLSFHISCVNLFFCDFASIVFRFHWQYSIEEHVCKPKDSYDRREFSAS